MWKVSASKHQSATVPLVPSVNKPVNPDAPSRETDRLIALRTRTPNPLRILSVYRRFRTFKPFCAWPPTVVDALKYYRTSDSPNRTRSDIPAILATME